MVKKGLVRFDNLIVGKKGKEVGKKIYKSMVFLEEIILIFLLYLGTYQ